MMQRICRVYTETSSGAYLDLISRSIYSESFNFICTIPSSRYNVNILKNKRIHLIPGINPLSGCQVIYDANRLSGFSVMGISIERNIRAICKTIFLVNRIILYLPVLRLGLVFLMYIVYLIFLTLYCFSTLVCPNLVSKRFGRFACFDLRLTLIGAVLWSAQLFLTILLLTGKTFIFKDAG